jgi:hypothetical protein
VQFTGLRDKNGNEIYEGGVVQFADAVRADRISRKWNTKTALSVIAHSDKCSRKRKSFEIEVIGNIYENPELLK